MSTRQFEYRPRVTRTAFLIAIGTLVTGVANCTASHTGRVANTPPRIVIQDQGSFAVGGTVVTAPGTFDPIEQGAYTPTPNPRGQTLHADHAYVFYQVPVDARKLPLVV